MNRLRRLAARCRHAAGGPRRERGSFAPYMAVIAVGIFLVMGLVVDGGGALNAGSRATSLAQEAARTAGQQIDPDQAIQGTAIVVNPQAARAAAQDYLAEAGVTGSVRITDGGQTLTVTVHDTYKTTFAALIGLGSIEVTGTAEAHLQTRPGG
jgi:Flp pilus assembly protein TadG